MIIKWDLQGNLETMRVSKSGLYDTRQRSPKGLYSVPETQDAIWMNHLILPSVSECGKSAGGNLFCVWQLTGKQYQDKNNTTSITLRCPSPFSCVPGSSVIRSMMTHECVLCAIVVHCDSPPQCDTMQDHMAGWSAGWICWSCLGLPFIVGFVVELPADPGENRL